MTKPGRYLLRMALFLLAVAALIVALLPLIERAYFNNPYLNGVIFTVLVLGIFYALRQVFLL